MGYASKEGTWRRTSLRTGRWPASVRWLVCSGVISCKFWYLTPLMHDGCSLFRHQVFLWQHHEHEECIMHARIFICCRACLFQTQLAKLSIKLETQMPKEVLVCFLSQNKFRQWLGCRMMRAGCELGVCWYHDDTQTESSIIVTTDDSSHSQDRKIAPPNSQICMRLYQLCSFPRISGVVGE